MKRVGAWFKPVYENMKNSINGGRGNRSSGGNQTATVENLPAPPNAASSVVATTTTDDVRLLDQVVDAAVYGGLMQSITTLAFISNSVGTATATWNVISLAGTNLGIGLLYIVHSLLDSKWDRDNEVSRQTPRQNFKVRFGVAAVSCIIFTSVSPVAYTFSFRVSDRTYLKFAVAVATSIQCISLLAAGKAYLQPPPKPYLRTVVSHIILGLITSGIGFAIERYLLFLRAQGETFTEKFSIG